LSVSTVWNPRKFPLRICPALGDLLAEHVRHAHVRDQKMDVAVVLRGEGNGLGAVGGGDDAVAASGEDPFCYLPQRFFVFDDQDGFTGRGALIGGWFLDRNRDLVGDGNQDREGGADAGLRTDVDG
jgi:hypothetical protein